MIAPISGRIKMSDRLSWYSRRSEWIRFCQSVIGAAVDKRIVGTISKETPTMATHAGGFIANIPVRAE